MGVFRMIDDREFLPANLSCCVLTFLGISFEGVGTLLVLQRREEMRNPVKLGMLGGRHSVSDEILSARSWDCKGSECV